MGLQYNGDYGAFNASDFHDLPMHHLAKFLHVCCAHKGDDVIFPHDLVDFFDVVKLPKVADNLIYLILISKDVDGR